jgi:hypothetical protein
MHKEVEIVIPGELKDESIFYYIIKNFDVIPNIKEASFTTEMGWAVVDFQGQENELDRLFQFLKEKNMKVNNK